MTSFHTAAARLIARHEALHTEISDGAVVGMEFLRFLRKAVTLHATMWPDVTAGNASLPRRLVE